MSVNLSFSVIDTATPAIRAKVAQCQPRRVAIRVAVPLQKHWRNHLAGLPPNKHGYPSTGFWEKAARMVKSRVVDTSSGASVELSNNHLGLRQRLYGGTISAKSGKYLTIPICAEAYGKLASEFGKLVLVIIADGRKFLCQWLGEGEGPHVLILRGAGNTKGHGQARAARHLKLKFLYVLKESVWQRGNPNVIPPDLAEVALEEVTKYVNMKVPE